MATHDRHTINRRRDSVQFSRSWLSLGEHRWVTSRECRSGIDDLYLRLNTKDGQIRFCRTHVNGWRVHPTDSTVDVAIHARGVPDGVDSLSIKTDMAATASVRERFAIGVGDEVCITGLFHPHEGKRKNIPIVRAGNIAAMPEEKVFTERYGYIDAYLIEGRSIGGISG